MALSLEAKETSDIEKISLNKVYRSDKIWDSYYFLLLNKRWNYYYVYTNKTDKLTPDELKSDKLLQILNDKQSWWKAFPKKWNYKQSNGKVYTSFLWNEIEPQKEEEIKYNKHILKLQN